MLNFAGKAGLAAILSPVATMGTGGYSTTNTLLVQLLVVEAAMTGFGCLAIPPVARDLSDLGGEMPGRLPQLLHAGHVGGQRLSGLLQIAGPGHVHKLSRFEFQLALPALIVFENGARTGAECAET